MNLQQSQSRTTSAGATRSLAEIDHEIAHLDAERSRLLAERRRVINFVGADEVAIGRTGTLVTLDGVAIVGANDVKFGRAQVITASRKLDGSIDLDLAATVWSEDSTMPSRDANGEVEYLTANGDIVPESKVKLVAASA
ncbi:hypothetical protein [Paraburkholderia youngii]|uniref:hypothetical protein n=1 Tax=Paraburkholderia youngii TaxID=2782701 RepID=UPI003D19A744